MCFRSSSASVLFVRWLRWLQYHTVAVGTFYAQRAARLNGNYSSGSLPHEIQNRPRSQRKNTRKSKCRVRNKNKTIELNFILILSVLVSFFFLCHASNACIHLWFLAFRTYELVRRLHRRISRMKKKTTNAEKIRERNEQTEGSIENAWNFFSISHHFRFLWIFFRRVGTSSRDKNANYSMNINLMYEQTMKSERQNNKKIEEKQRMWRWKKTNRKEKYAQRIFKSVTTESFDFEILRTRFIPFLLSVDFHFSNFEQSKSFGLMRTMLSKLCEIFFFLCIFIGIAQDVRSTVNRQVNDFGAKIGIRAILCMWTHRPNTTNAHHVHDNN